MDVIWTAVQIQETLYWFIVMVSPKLESSNYSVIYARSNLDLIRLLHVLTSDSVIILISD